jgi:hypothetical protein
MTRPPFEKKKKKKSYQDKNKGLTLGKQNFLTKKTKMRFKRNCSLIFVAINEKITGDLL